MTVVMSLLFNLKSKQISLFSNMNYSIKLQFIPLMTGEEHIFMSVIFHSPSAPITISYQE